jgi:hypothetical protein
VRVDPLTPARVVRKGAQHLETLLGIVREPLLADDPQDCFELERRAHEEQSRTSSGVIVGTNSERPPVEIARFRRTPPNPTRHPHALDILVSWTAAADDAPALRAGRR